MIHFYKHDPTCEYDKKTLEQIGVEASYFNLLQKNPSYICSENNYSRSQSLLKASFNSLNEALGILEKRNELQIVNFCFGMETASSDCDVCDGVGYAPIASILNKTFYEHNMGSTPFEIIELSDGTSYKSYYGWGSKSEFSEVELNALWENKRIQGFDSKPTLKEFLEWCKSPLSLCSIGTHYCVKARAKNLGEKEDSCIHCEGSGTVYSKETPIKNILHIWVINKRTGECFGIDINNVKNDELETVVTLLKSSKNIIEKQLKTFVIDENLENNNSDYNYWNGNLHESTSGWDQICRYDTFDEFNREWGEPDDLNELVTYYFTEKGLSLWMLHPRKGCSAHVCIKNVSEYDIDAIKKYFNLAIERVNIVFGNLDK